MLPDPESVDPGRSRAAVRAVLSGAILGPLVVGVAARALLASGRVAPLFLLGPALLAGALTGGLAMRRLMEARAWPHPLWRGIKTAALLAVALGLCVLGVQYLGTVDDKGVGPLLGLVVLLLTLPLFATAWTVACTDPRAPLPSGAPSS